MSIHQSYSKLLIDEEPLQVLPGLAAKIGLHEAIILQQIHFWLNPKHKSGKIVDGTRWIFNSYAQWHDQFPFFTEKVIGNAIRSLEKQGYILSRQDLNSTRSDRRKWYTVNYSAFGDDHSPCRDVGGPSRDVGSLSRDVVNRNTENTSENTTDTYSSDDENDTTDGAKTPTVEEMFDTFWSAYPRKVAKGAARKAFNKVIKTVPLDVLVDAVLKQKKSEQWKDPKFIPHPATWLNGERWEDEETRAIAQGGGQVVRKADKSESQKAWDDIMKPYYEGNHEN